MRLYNTLTRRVEPFTPLDPPTVRMYTCGPTVYRYAHLGNLRSYLMADWLRRALEGLGYRVVQVKNITDVGHMRQERLERGEDKVVAAALAEGRTPQELARFYTEAFLRDEARLNILPAHHLPRASEHIPQMLALIQRLLERGYAYTAGGNVYFAVDRFHGYGKLSGNTGGGLLQGVRVEADPLKRDQRDFALWKAAEPGRALKWPSPWGEGFPGWHIECSAMATYYLGPQIDIHTGGVDNIFPHHEGEIAQCEAAFGLPFVRHWVHGQHLLADGVKMAKSLANDYTLEDLVARGFDPLAFRYLCLTVRYRTRLNFTFTALKAAQRALLRLRHRVWEWSLAPAPEEEPQEALEPWRRAFWERVADDLDLPGALAVVWRLATTSHLGPAARLRLLLEFDRVLGLGLERVPTDYHLPTDLLPLLQEHQRRREAGDYPAADALRLDLHQRGYRVEDTGDGARAYPLSPWERRRERWPAYSSPREVPSLLSHPDAFPFTVAVVLSGHREQAERCLRSLLSFSPQEAQVLAVDNGSPEDMASWLEEWARSEPRLQVVHTDHTLGEAQARNIALKQALGRLVALVDPSVEALGDFLTPLARALESPSVGLVGPWGLRTADLRHFYEVEEGEVDAMQAYLMAFPRALLHRVGLMRESFRFYRNLDLDFSFQFRAAGYRILALPSLPLRRHPHLVWEALAPGVREELSRKNFHRFYRRWHHRTDLLVSPGRR